MTVNYSITTVFGMAYSYVGYYTRFSYIQDLGLQPEDNFVLKVVQLEELIHVRHSVFVIGNAGTGKQMHVMV